MTDLAEATDSQVASRRHAAFDADQFVTVKVDDQLFAIPMLIVDSIQSEQTATPIPLAPKAVTGATNLRGHIVTVIDIRTRLGLAPRQSDDLCMHVVVEHRGELYSLEVDSIGEVEAPDPDTFEATPSTLASNWRAVTSGVYRLEGDLLLVHDVNQLLDFDSL
ncbi:MAG: chemotaxis protein CheW [Alphaproteobacteria bacterium]|jgi:purine-binding chemotaxis protein CheW|nr:chemotaxis protein CheW [Alphaproteobacteria bacterium]